MHLSPYIKKPRCEISQVTYTLWHQNNPYIKKKKEKLNFSSKLNLFPKSKKKGKPFCINISICIFQIFQFYN